MNTTPTKIIAAKRFFEANPSGRISTGIWSEGNWTRAQFYKWFHSCLFKKVGGDRLTAREMNKILDGRTINDYVGRNFRHSGCRNLLRDPAMQRRYPHINNQPNED